MSVTVLLVDDVPELRAVLRQRLRLRGGFDVVAEAGDGAGAVAAATRHQPDLIVVDLGLPDLAGHHLVARLRLAASTAQIVVYTGSVSRERFALADDVDAYVPKTRDVSALVELLVDLTGRGRQAATLDLGPSAADVALARRFLVAHCQRWDCQDVLGDAQLVVSELVTNALRHAGSRCELAIAFRNGWLRLEIRDDGPGVPDVQAADLDSEGGRGLLLVSAVTDAWGVEPFPGSGKVVWAELESSVGRSSDTGGRDAATVRRPTGPEGRQAQRRSDRPPGQPGARAAVSAVSARAVRQRGVRPDRLPTRRVVADREAGRPVKYRPTSGSEAAGRRIGSHIVGTRPFA